MVVAKEEKEEETVVVKCRQIITEVKSSSICIKREDKSAPVLLFREIASSLKSLSTVSVQVIFIALVRSKKKERKRRKKK